MRVVKLVSIVVTAMSLFFVGCNDSPPAKGSGSQGGGANGAIGGAGGATSATGGTGGAGGEDTQPGDVLWSTTFGPNYHGTWIRSIFADDDGSIVVLGVSMNGVDAGGGELPRGTFLSRRSSDGAHVWSRVFCENLNNTRLARHPSGDIVLMGKVNGECAFDDVALSPPEGEELVLIARLDPNGDLVSAHAEALDGTATRLAVRDDGTLLLSGVFRGSFELGGLQQASSDETQRDMFVAAFDGQGAGLWVRTFSCEGHCSFPHLALSPAGVLLVGIHDGIDLDGLILEDEIGKSNLFAMSLDASGDVAWARELGSAAIIAVAGTARDSLGNAVICGTFNGNFDFGTTNLANSDTNKEPFMIQLSDDGSLIDAVATNDATWRAVGVDPASNWLLAGRLDGARVRAYSNSFDELWESTALKDSVFEAVAPHELGVVAAGSHSPPGLAGTKKALITKFQW